MLVLARRRDEELVLFGPDGVELGRIMIVDIRGDRVRLGFQFPGTIGIHRAEVADQIGAAILGGREDLA